MPGMKYIRAEKLIELNITQSMSRKGNWLNNFPTKNLLGRTKEEMFYGKEHLCTNMKQLKFAIIDYIFYYNIYRIVNKLGMSPVKYRIENFGLM